MHSFIEVGIGMNCLLRKALYTLRIYGILSYKVYLWLAEPIIVELKSSSSLSCRIFQRNSQWK